MLDWLAYSVTNGISSISTMTVIEKEVKDNKENEHFETQCDMNLLFYAYYLYFRCLELNEIDTFIKYDHNVLCKRRTGLSYFFKPKFRFIFISHKMMWFVICLYKKWMHSHKIKRCRERTWIYRNDHQNRDDVVYVWADDTFDALFFSQKFTAQLIHFNANKLLIYFGKVWLNLPSMYTK